MTDPKTTKNRLHIDVNSSGWQGPRAVRRERVEAEAERLVALGATRRHAMEEAGSDFYAVAMTDPEGNEFDVN